MKSQGGIFFEYLVNLYVIEIKESAEDEVVEQEVDEEGEDVQTISMNFQSLIFTAPSDLSLTSI